MVWCCDAVDCETKGLMNAATPNPNSTLVLSSTLKGVTTLKMNMPARLNGWTLPMMDALKAGLGEASDDADTRAVILTGADPYYCAGVNLSSTIQPGHPKKLHAMIIEHNEGLFNAFIDFPKPILVAFNGPGIGACVTSATLCDGIIASERATFSTPFAALGVPPEGCSSLLFERLMGEEAARRMLGGEGWKPDAAQALEAGLVQWVVPHETLMDEAQQIAEGWIGDERARTYRGGVSQDELREVNAQESVAVANAFLGRPFLMGQSRFLWRKKKRAPALTFLLLWLMRPVWALLLPKEHR